VFICIALVLSVLLQSAKGEGLAGAFGGTSLTGTVFGGRGAASFLSRATTVLAVGFMSSCIVLSFINPSTGTSSVLQGSSAVEEAAREAPAQAPVQQPVTPGASDQSTGQPPAGPEGDLFQQPAATDQGATPDQGTATDQPQGEGTEQPEQPDETNP